MIMLTGCGGHKTETEMKKMCEKLPMGADAIVRISKIEVYPEYLAEYRVFAAEVGERSLLTEPGVLSMYAMADKKDSTRISILEIYADQESYRRHIASEHFQKYKQGTLHMVKSLELADQNPMNPKMRVLNGIEE